jgi:hypothetical protein
LPLRQIRLYYSSTGISLQWLRFGMYHQYIRSVYWIAQYESFHVSQMPVFEKEELIEDHDFSLTYI